MAAQVVAFSLAPANAIQGIIDMGSAQGRKLFEMGAKGLFHDDLYDCEPDGLFQFLRSLGDRADIFGWSGETGILAIPRDPADLANLATDDLLESYGEIDLPRIREYEATYIGSECRAAKDNFMMYHALMNSISTAGKSKILVWKESYMIRNRVSANLLLKIIIRESYLDTNATTASIREKLSNLDSYILTVGSDIVKFNNYVEERRPRTFW